MVEDWISCHTLQEILNYEILQMQSAEGLHGAFEIPNYRQDLLQTSSLCQILATSST